MRKLAVALTVAILAVPVSLATIAVAASKIPPQKLTAHVSPKHRSHAPYSWQVHGKLVLPKRRCPPGTKDPQYCSHPPHKCKGRLHITFRLAHNPYLKDSGRVVLSFYGRVNGHCGYRTGKHTVPKRDLTADRRIAKGKYRWVRVYVKVRFLGNADYTAKSARTQTVLAKLTTAHGHKHKHKRHKHTHHKHKH